MMRLTPKVFLSIALLVAAQNASAQSLLLDRNALDTLLGSSRSDETFEAIGLMNGSGISAEGFLSSSSSWGGYPSGLIVNGINIESAASNPSDYFLNWYGPGVSGATSHTIAAGMSLRVDFWQPALAFGVDLKDFQFGAHCLTAGITVFGADDVTVLYSGSLDMANPNPALGVFFGYENAAGGGIGSVVFSNLVPGPGEPGYSPQIDNLSFAPIPEPSTIALGALGLVGLWVMGRREKRW